MTTERQPEPSTPDTCRECGADSYVINSRPMGSYRWRIRKCRNPQCGCQWDTYESLVNPDDLPRDVVDSLSA